MRVFLLALGTRGDVELFVTLGAELRRRGHEVVLGSSGFYGDRIRAAGLDAVALGGGTRAELLALLRSLGSVADTTRRTALFVRHWLRPQLAAANDQITAAAGRADYFVNNLKLVLQRGDRVIPGAAVTYDPPLDAADLPRYNTHRHGNAVLELVAMSRRLADPGGAWGPRYQFTGFWAPEPDAAARPAPELAAFLDAGPPPVVVTLGSMVTFDADRFVKDTTDALRLVGVRGVLVGGWSEVAPGGGPDDTLCCVPEAPYDWLFPRSCCVVHHGGCGTLAAVLRAGRPSVVLPQVKCQEIVGRLLMRENLATGVLETVTLRPAELADAVDRARTDEAVRHSISEWQALVRAEPGVRGAADLIEAHARSVIGDGSPPGGRP